MAAWRWALGAGVLAGALAGAVWLVAPRGDADTGGIAVLGDAAPALHAAMGTVQALPVGSAAFTLVSVSDWDRLRYIADMAALCGPDCAGAPGLVRAVHLTPRGSRKVVFVNLAAWPGLTGEAEGAAPADDADFTCLAQTILAERQQIRPAPPPDCAAAVPFADGTRWVLPFDLGAL